MTKRWLALAAALALLPSCDVASVASSASKIAVNQCQSDSDCGGGVCTNEQCRSRSGTFQTVLFEVTAPADGSEVAGIQFLKVLEKLDTLNDASLELDLVSQVVGQVKAVGRTCVPQFVDDKGDVLVFASDTSVPAIVTLLPKTRALGLNSPRSVAQSLIPDMKSWRFSLNVPPGPYDIYIEPKRQPDDACPVPPQLVRDQVFEGGSSPLVISLPEPTVFELHVAWPLGDGALNGWFVDMLDPVTGRVISNRVKLALGKGGKTDYVARVSYFPVVQQAPSQQQAEELVRLSPPAKVAGPTILLARSALGLFSANSGKLTDLTALPTSVKVQGQVTSQSTPKPVAATVTLVATKIDGIDPGVLASFAQTVSVGADGQFEADLLPGDYRVSAVPRTGLDSSAAAGDDSRLASVTQPWEVASSPSVQAGKVVELSSAIGSNGQVLDPSGRAPAAALVQAVPSPASIHSDVLRDPLGEAAFVPRASTGTVDGNGYFAFNSDPGTFDIAVRPSPGTGFGWSVLPGAAITTISAGLNLATFTIPFPVSYGGTVTVPGSESRRVVPGALIRTYVYLRGREYTADASLADSVVQIGETRADDMGGFEILIPAGLNSDLTQAQ